MKYLDKMNQNSFGDMSINILVIVSYLLRATKFTDSFSHDFQHLMPSLAFLFGKLFGCRDISLRECLCGRLGIEETTQRTQKFNGR